MDQPEPLDRRTPVLVPIAEEDAELDTVGDHLALGSSLDEP